MHRWLYGMLNCDWLIGCFFLAAEIAANNNQNNDKDNATNNSTNNGAKIVANSLYSRC